MAQITSQDLYEQFRDTWSQMASLYYPKMSLHMSTIDHMNDAAYETLSSDMHVLRATLQKLSRDLMAKIQGYGCDPESMWHLDIISPCPDWYERLRLLRLDSDQVGQMSRDLYQIKIALDVESNRQPGDPQQAQAMTQWQEFMGSFAGWMEQFSQKTGIRKEVLFAMLGAVALVVVFMLFRGKKK